MSETKHRYGHGYATKEDYEKWGKEDAIYSKTTWAPMNNPDHKYAHIYLKAFKETMMLNLLKQNHE